MTGKVTRVNLEIYNDNQELPLQVREIGGGSLTIPIKASSVNVLRYSIPNSWTPLFEFKDNTYRMRVSYNGQSYTKYVDFIDLGSSHNVYDIDHILLMMNACIKQCVIGLNSLIAVPSITEIPYFSYDINTDLYKLTANKLYYDETLGQPMKIWINEALFNFFQSIPTIHDQISYPAPTMTDFRFVFRGTTSNTSGNYITLNQENVTFSNYVDPRQLIITTSMPIQSEIFPLSTGGSGQVYASVLQSYIFNYSDGNKGFRGNLDFNASVNQFRPISLTSTDIYSIKCNISYKTRDGKLKDFYLAPNASANIVLEFYE